MKVKIQGHKDYGSKPKSNNFNALLLENNLVIANIAFRKNIFLQFVQVKLVT